MAGSRISDRDIAAIRERNHIDEVVGDYVQLRRAGADSLKGLCPFHDEKSPSFHVRPNHGHFHCFGCGEGGDVYAFVQKVEHITFVEAVERLADRIGYTITYTQVKALTVAATGCGAPGSATYVVGAVPLSVNATGNRTFCSDESGVIHQDITGGAAPATDTACEALSSLQ